MNILPSSPLMAASLAGSDRAASQQLAGSTAAETTAANASARETVDSIDKGNASEDSGADGRQTLDTFERQKRDSDPETDDDVTKPVAATAVGIGIPSGSGGHLDFTA